MEGSSTRPTLRPPAAWHTPDGRQVGICFLKPAAVGRGDFGPAGLMPSPLPRQEAALKVVEDSRFVLQKDKCRVG
jgi:hypothetical protein